LLPANSRTPHLGQSSIPDWLTTYALDQQTQLRAFANAVDGLLIIVAILTAAGVVLAIFLRSGRAPAADQGPDMAALG
jgi:hypothetical protein